MDNDKPLSIESSNIMVRYRVYCGKIDDYQPVECHTIQTLAYMIDHLVCKYYGQLKPSDIEISVVFSTLPAGIHEL